MFQAEEKLSSIVEQLENGIAPSCETVHSVLSWFGAKSRGRRIISQIYCELEQKGLVTSPDFKDADIKDYISFKMAPDLNHLNDPIYRIGDLPAATRLPESAKPDWPFHRVASIMIAKKFSQLPVMTSPRSLKGVISWASIGARFSLGTPPDCAKGYMDKPHVVDLNDSIFDVIKMIVEHEYVLVQAKDGTYCGIVTASDFSEQFSIIAEPFLLIGEIERCVRGMLHGKYTAQELEGVKAPSDGKKKSIKSLTELTFGDYVHLLQNENNWKKLDIKVDGKGLVSRLDEIRRIRNDAMHFNQDIGADRLEFLRESVDYLKKIYKYGVILD